MAATPTPQSTTRSPRRRWIGPLLLVSTLLAALAGVVVALSAAGEPSSRGASPPRFAVPVLDVAPGSAVPFQAGARPAAPGQAGDARAWADRVSETTDIPARTLVAYADAEVELRQSVPRCQLTWPTLAGVGRLESRHGLFGGAQVGGDGRLSQPIIGVPLDGSPGVRAIKDTDSGALDGDQQWDRAVGSMQFLPTTWTRWAARASGDGQVPDPQNVDDSALTAARYLCASGGDLATGRGWWKAVLTYNASAAYGKDVFSAADAYARAAKALP